MSIIYNALKKTQQHRETLNDVVPLRKEKRKITWLILSLILMSLFLTIYVQRSPTQKNTHLVLNGVFLSEKNKIAVINHQLFNLGETVNGMKIITISANSIELQNKNSALVLPLAN